jgi:hypothetical protein
MKDLWRTYLTKRAGWLEFSVVLVAIVAAVVAVKHFVPGAFSFDLR